MTSTERVTVPVAIGAALLLLLSVWLMNRQHRALGNALRDAEAAHLALTHQTVESELNWRQLQGSVADLLAKNAELAAAVESAKAAAPSAQPVSASELQTAPEKIVYVTKTATVPGPPGPAPAQCSLTPGESAWFKVDLIELQTKEQNTLVAGTAELWAQGADLLDRRVLGPSRFQSTVSSSAALAPPAAPRWGAEALGECSAKGCGLGAGVLFPPVSFLGLRLEARAGVLLGPDASAVAGLGLRF